MPVKVSPELKKQCEDGIRSIFLNDPPEMERQLMMFRATCAIGENDGSPKDYKMRVVADYCRRRK